MSQPRSSGQQPRLLILGGTGMLGHRLWLAAREQFETRVTVRGASTSALHGNLFDPARVIPGVIVEDFDSVVQAVAIARPTVVVNCIGIVKQRAAAKDPVASLVTNAVFPHRLARLCQATGARLIHLSTDCVFSGRRGNYREDDRTDPEDLYGQTKLLGEAAGPGCLTLRTSMIGRELATSQGLVEWFLGRRGGSAAGYPRAIFSGFTTGALADLIIELIAEHPSIEGLWHVAAEPISKLDLLTLIRDSGQLEIELIPDAGVVIDRSLDATRFRRETGWSPPSWPAMIAELTSDRTPYDEIRRQRAHQ